MAANSEMAGRSKSSLDSEGSLKTEESMKEQGSSRFLDNSLSFLGKKANLDITANSSRSSLGLLPSDVLTNLTLDNIAADSFNLMLIPEKRDFLSMSSRSEEDKENFPSPSEGAIAKMSFPSFTGAETNKELVQTNLSTNDISQVFLVPEIPSKTRPTLKTGKSIANASVFGASPKGLSDSMLRPAVDVTPSLPPRAPGGWGAQFSSVLDDTSPGGDPQDSLCQPSLNASGFPWEQLIGKQLPKADASKVINDSEIDFNMDPSFYSGKISARSTSFGGNPNGSTRDENFSDFSKPLMSHASKFNESASSVTGVYNPFDLNDMNEQSMENVGDLDFEDRGDLKNFFDQEEKECLEANKFLEEEKMDNNPNTTGFSGISEKSGLHANSSLWTQDMSKCEYFQHHSSRLGSLEDSIAEAERPAFGFLHKIRSPEHQPFPLLEDSNFQGNSPETSTRTASRLTYSLTPSASEGVPTPQASADAFNKDKISDQSSESGGGSANSTFIPSANTTKTVVSLNQSATIKAEDLAEKLEALSGKLGHLSGISFGYPDVVEDSLNISEKSIAKEDRSLRQVGGVEDVAVVSSAAVNKSVGDLSISTISKILSEASISSDPQQFVNVILDCIKRQEGSSGSTTPIPASRKEIEAKTVRFDHVPPHLSDSLRQLSQQVVAGLSAAEGRSLTPDMPNIPYLTQASKSSLSEPTTPRSEDFKGLEKTTSVPTNLNNNRRRHPSATRHSSPIKERPSRQVATVSGTLSGQDLEDLLDEAALTPSMSMTATKHLYTSTPYQPQLNLSTVIVDNLTHNKSISPLCGQVTVAGSVDSSDRVGVVGPSIRSNTNGNTSHSIVNRSANLAIESLVVDGEVKCGHVWNYIHIPVHHTLKNPLSINLTVKDIYIDDVNVPIEYKDYVIQFKSQTFEISPQSQFINIEYLAKKYGIFTMLLNIVLPQYPTFSTTVKFSIEEPNLKMLTKNGHTIDFGIVPANFSTSDAFMLANGGNSSLPIALEIVPTHSVLSFDPKVDVGACEFSIPPVNASTKDGEAMAKEVQLYAHTYMPVRPGLPQTFVSELKVKLGDPDSNIVLGSVNVQIKVACALLAIQSKTPVVLASKNGSESANQVLVRNEGDIALTVDVSLPEAARKVIRCESQFKIEPGRDKYLELFFMPTMDTAKEHSFVLKLIASPGNVTHSVPVLTQVLANKNYDLTTHNLPELKVDKLQRDTVPVKRNLDHFPVLSDRFSVCWFSVPLANNGAERMTLQNSIDLPVTLDIQVRDGEEFAIMQDGNMLKTSCITLRPKEIRDVHLNFSPKADKLHFGKLALKLQNFKVGGRSHKACVSLVGIGGHSEIKVLDNSSEKEVGKSHAFALDSNGNASFKVVNNGDATGLVSLVDMDRSASKIEPAQFLLGPGSEQTVVVRSGSGVTKTFSLAIYSSSKLLARMLTSGLGGSSHKTRWMNNPKFIAVMTASRLWERELPFNSSPVLPEDEIGHALEQVERFDVNFKLSSQMRPFNEMNVEETLSESQLLESSPPKKIVPLKVQAPSASHDVGGNTVSFVPDRVTLKPGEETVVRMTNTSSQTVHWDAKCSESYLSITPPGGQLAAGCQAVLLLTAAEHVSHHPSGINQCHVEIFSDQTVERLPVLVKSASANAHHAGQPVALSVQPNPLDMGPVLLGQNKKLSVVLTNENKELIMWRAQVQPSFFSLPQPSGLLNPGQKIPLPVCFRPASHGPSQASVDFVCSVVKGEFENQRQGAPLRLNISGVGVVPEPATKIPATAAVSQPARAAISLDSEMVTFPDTAVGSKQVMKITVKNRTPRDEKLKILPLNPSSNFCVLLTEVEVKNQGFSRFPVYFKPRTEGQFTDHLQIVVPGKVLTVKLSATATPAIS